MDEDYSIAEEVRYPSSTVGIVMAFNIFVLWWVKASTSLLSWELTCHPRGIEVTDVVIPLHTNHLLSISIATITYSICTCMYSYINTAESNMCTCSKHSHMQQFTLKIEEKVICYQLELGK